jgi:hypothetical protein
MGYFEPEFLPDERQNPYGKEFGIVREHKKLIANTA